MLSLEFYCDSSLKMLYWVLYYFPIPFMLFIIDHWLDHTIEYNLLYQKVENMEQATFVKIVNVGQVISFERFAEEEFELEPGVKEKHYTFLFNTVRFVYDEADNCFINLQERFHDQPPKTILQKFKFGRFISEIGGLWNVYGKNEMFVAPPKVMEIIIAECFSMMGVVESICVLFLYLDGIWMSLLVTSFLVLRGRYLAVTGAFNSYESNMQQVLKKSDTLVIRRNEDEEYQKMSANSDGLVPGDIIEITKGMNMTVDAVLISGSCIFNEEGITGVTINQVKYPLMMDDNIDALTTIPKKNMLLAGSTCVFLRSEINEGCLAIVIATGYNTFKGKLLRELLMPKKVVFESFNQAISLVWFLASLFLIGSVAFVIHALTHTSAVQLGWYDIVENCFVIFVSTVKPCLPYCLFMGIQSSEERLKKMGVETTNNYKINQSARCKTIIFDKTGTLTTNNNKVAGIRAVENPQQFNQAPGSTAGRQTMSLNQISGESLEQIKKMMANQNKKLQSAESAESKGAHLGQSVLNVSDLMEKGPSMNHLIFNINFNNSILKVGNGLVGDDLELELYKQCPYEITFKFDPKVKTLVKGYLLKPEFAGKNDLPESFSVVKTFEYDYDLKKSSVVVRSSKGELYILTKGAPEEISLSSIPMSFPPNYSEELFQMTFLGYRLISFGYNKLSEDQLALDRKDLETSLIFQGFISNESFIRSGAVKTVENLSMAQIQLIMATGDNLFTGISVAVKTGLIREDMVVYTLHQLTKENSETHQLYWVNFQKMTSKEKIASHDTPEAPLEEYDTPDITTDIMELIYSKRKIVLALTANAYEEFMATLEKYTPKQQAEINHFIRTRALIYARCKPVQKKRLIEDFKRYHRGKNYVVMFVGDEANDAEAIEAADVSFLMKRSHLSFRASFTTSNSDFSAVEALIREGKCSSESGYLTFKFFLFLTCMQLLAMFFLLQYFISLNTAQNIILDIIISMFFCDYINSFQASMSLSYTIPNHSMYNIQFMTNLVLHSLAGIVTVLLGYNQLKSLSFYQTPFEIIPYMDQKSNNMSLNNHKVYEGIFFFNSIILLQLFFFLFTNLKSRYRVSLLHQKDSLYYTIFCMSLFFHLATLSELDEPSFADQVIIDFFNIGKTFGLIWIYLKMLLMYCCLAYIIEVGLEISFAFSGYMKYQSDKDEYIQCPEDV